MPNGKDSIKRLGNNWPNDAKIPMSNEFDINGSKLGQMWLFNSSWSARFRMTFDDDVVVITSTCRIIDEFFVFQTWWRCSRKGSEKRSEPKKTIFNGLIWRFVEKNRWINIEKSERRQEKSNSTWVFVLFKSTIESIEKDKWRNRSNKSVNEWENLAYSF